MNGGQGCGRSLPKHWPRSLKQPLAPRNEVRDDGHECPSPIAKPKRAGGVSMRFLSAAPQFSSRRPSSPTPIWAGQNRSGPERCTRWLSRLLSQVAAWFSGRPETTTLATAVEVPTPHLSSARLACWLCSVPSACGRASLRCKRLLAIQAAELATSRTKTHAIRGLLWLYLSGLPRLPLLLDGAFQSGRRQSSTNPLALRPSWLAAAASKKHRCTLHLYSPTSMPRPCCCQPAHQIDTAANALCFR